MSTRTSDPVNRAPAHMAAIVSPVLAFGATFAARKLLSSAYRSLTGSPAPSHNDRNASLTSIIVWAALSGATAAVIEALIFRNTARLFDE